MGSKRICIVTQSHLCRNPRVLKEAVTLAKVGYDIYILNSIFCKELQNQDLDLIANKRIYLHSVSDLTNKNPQSILDRVLRRIGVLLIKYLKFQTPFALGYGLFRYIKRCKEIKADLYICHQEMATYIGNKLIKLGYKVAYDFEDWYSEDLLLSARKERPIKLLRNTEAIALKKGVFVTTTSNALAKRLADIYSCKCPEVIYNVFPSCLNLLDKVKHYDKVLKLFWFSQTIGPGRGLEEFIPLLAGINRKLELHLLGAIDAKYKIVLKALVSSTHQIFFHELVDEKSLPAKIACYDIGLALEKVEPLSRNYTITNKFFQYIQAGLPIIATETAGQLEAFIKNKPGFLLPVNPTYNKIIELKAWLADISALKEARFRAKEMAHVFNWENESTKIIRLVEQALKN